MRLIKKLSNDAKSYYARWRQGLQKVSLSKLQHVILGMSLKESKLNVDALLDDQQVIIPVANADLAKKFIHEAENIGVNCVLEL